MGSETVSGSEAGEAGVGNASLAMAFVYCLVAYVIAVGAAFGAGVYLKGAYPGMGPLWLTFWADVVGTLVIFGFSFGFRNSSFYDAYWSVAPLLIVVYWVLLPEAQGALVVRQVMVVSLVYAWGIRLTINWSQTWHGLHHQDWRYDDLEAASGRFYWFVSFAGIHMFPTVQVFLGCIAAYPALVTGRQPLGWLDGVAFVVTAGAIAIEATADLQLRRFVASERKPEDVLDTGLWAYSRHPNYFGEICFWLGLLLFGVAAGPFRWWMIAGFLAITLMFVFISLPMIDRRMLRRRPHYAEHMKRISSIIPWFPKKA